MLKKILLFLLVCLAVFAVVVQMQPSEYSVTRTTVIAAPPETIFPLINDFHQWDRWSPWAKLDPNMKAEHEGPSSGPGAVYRWDGNFDVGKGSMKITDSREPSLVAIDLTFYGFLESTSVTRFTLTPEGAGTRVEWNMAGASDFVSKGFSFAMGGMDKAIGPDFEKGLAALKEVAEGR